MAKLALSIGKRSVTLDTDDPTRAQRDFSEALDATIDEQTKSAVEAKESELSADVTAAKKTREYLADSVIATMKASDDKVMNARVDSDEKVTEYRKHLLRLPVDELTAEHRMITGGAKTKAPNTSTEQPETPEIPDDSDETKLSAKIAPKTRMMVVNA